jgi:hypothetical protein
LVLTLISRACSYYERMDRADNGVEAATQSQPAVANAMLPFVTNVPAPEAKSTTELVVIAHHALFLNAGFTVYLPPGDYIDPSNKLPSQFNARTSQWLVAYEHPKLANKIQVIWAIWGEKILVTLEEWGEKGEVEVAVDNNNADKDAAKASVPSKVNKTLMVCLKFFQVRLFRSISRPCILIP